MHGGGGGVGTAAILLLRESGNPCYVTAGSDDKCRACIDLGATAAINYRTEEFAPRVRALTDGRGVDVILDHIGARYLAGNVEALGTGGRLVDPSEIAATLVFLLSDLSSMITGQNLVVDGGVAAKFHYRG